MANPNECKTCIERTGGQPPCDSSYADGECPSVITKTTELELKALSADIPGQPED